ncbi:MAG TPA: hypothetical protein PLL12_08045, partial [Aestuariivirga sp.]|nr:hypothetical protein [Aestuariivirga sp.]
RPPDLSSSRMSQQRVLIHINGATKKFRHDQRKLRGAPVYPLPSIVETDLSHACYRKNQI